MQKFTDVFAETIPFLCKTAIAFALAFLIGGIAYCFADEPTDWHDNTLSEQIQQEERVKAKAQWREENGISSIKQILPHRSMPICIVMSSKNKQKLTALGVNNETDLQNLCRIGSKSRKERSLP